MSGRAATSSQTKHKVMTVISATTNASSRRNPRCWSARITNTSSPVSTTPPSNGTPNSSRRPIAVPSTSARSHATIAACASTNSATATGRG